MDINNQVLNIAKKAKEASRILATVPETVKNKVLLSMADSLIKNSASLIRANKKDLNQARKQGESSAFLDRLILNEKRINQMSESLKSVAVLEDP
ncbi:MAG: gamma-glutamyl-phosphate reductase, partial [Candidatus Thorarchaeota archaeon]